MHNTQELLQNTKLKLTYVDCQQVKPKDGKEISLWDILTILPEEKRKYLTWADDILPDAYSIDEDGNETLISNKTGKFYIHLFYWKQINLPLEYVNDSLSEEEFYQVRKLYYEYLNRDHK